MPVRRQLCPHLCDGCLTLLEFQLLRCHLRLHDLHLVRLRRRDHLWRCEVLVHVQDALLLQHLLERAWRFSSEYIGWIVL